MTVAPEVLEQRLAALEQQMIHLRCLVEPRGETPARRGARLLAQGRREKARHKAAWAQAYAQMGLSGQPVSPEQLRAMMAAEGIKPEENLFSRGIVEMRDE
jgi:hypothetical protein